MPWFFQFSKNGRRGLHLAVKERKKYVKPNSSTMNRICASFDDIGNINLNYANVAPFNWQMLLSSNETVYNISAVKLFCEMDDIHMSNFIENMQQNEELDSYSSKISYGIIADSIKEKLIESFGSLEAIYPSIVKYLFAGVNANKVSHKQMFWRVFGDIACEELKKNMETYVVCDKCGMKTPSWASSHVCPKNVRGFFECCDCGAWCERTNSKQCRCASCQKEFNKLQNTFIQRSRRKRKIA